MNYLEYEDYLAHHGIKGMKWGVRRYQNYDGSYTRAGLKRYNESMSKYEKADSRYKTAKSDYKQAKKSGSSMDGMKSEMVNAKMARKKAKQKLEKDYKHLKQDKLGDKGKALYASGKTITGNNQVTSILNKVGSLSMAAAMYNYKTGTLGNVNVTRILAGAGIGAIGISSIKGAVDYSQNKKLRAYYSHTSNY